MRVKQAAKAQSCSRCFGVVSGGVYPCCLVSFCLQWQDLIFFTAAVSVILYLRVLEWTEDAVYSSHPCAESGRWEGGGWMMALVTALVIPAW